MKFGNRVKVATATTGTGTLTFGAAISNKFMTPAEAGMSDGDVVSYVIIEGTDFEVGIGKIGGSKTTLARTKVEDSKIGGTAGTTKMTLAGSAEVFFAGTRGGWDALDDRFYDDALFAMELSDIQSKVLGLYNGWADGFGTELGVDGVASTNELYDGVNQWYVPFSSQETPLDATHTAAGNIVGTTIRQLVDAAAITANGDSAVLTFQAGSGQLELSKVYIGEAAASGDPYDFAATPTQVFFNSGNAATGLLNSSEKIASDTISISVDATKNLVISFYCPTNGIAGTVETLANFTAYTKSGDDAATVNASGYSTAARDLYALQKIEIASAIQNMTLISNSESAAAQETFGSVAAQVIENEAVTPQTDFSMEVSRDNGTTWSLATLALKSTTGNVKLYADTCVDISGQPAGTTMRWRFRTLNNKNVAITGALIKW